MNNQLQEAPERVSPRPSLMATAASSREVAEIQSAMTIAKNFPRDQNASIARIMSACGRIGLAEKAVYQYARGGTSITGPSIRLAEELARDWGNIYCGVRELEQVGGVSTVETFAWDLETGTKHISTFQVAHKRGTRQGSYDLTDPRDIYELVANNGARRLRACILKMIPGDIVDQAVAACEATLRADVQITPELVAGVVESFAKYGVTEEQLEARIQRKLGAITPGLVVQLRNIIVSLADGMSKPGDWFETIEQETPGEEQKEENQSPAEKAKAALKKRQQADQAKAREESKAPKDEGPIDIDRVEAQRQEWIEQMPDLLGKVDERDRKNIIKKYLGGNFETATLEQLRECGKKLENL